MEPMRFFDGFCMGEEEILSISVILSDFSPLLTGMFFETNSKIMISCLCRTDPGIEGPLNEYDLSARIRGSFTFG